MQRLNPKGMTLIFPCRLAIQEKIPGEIEAMNGVRFPNTDSYWFKKIPLKTLLLTAYNSEGKHKLSHHRFLQYHNVHEIHSFTQQIFIEHKLHQLLKY